MKAGTIQIARGMIHISCEPHVAIKLCRVFGGVRRYKAGEFTMSATPGHAFELDWFRKMHPMNVEPDSDRAFRKLIKTEKRKLAMLAEIEADGYVPREFELALPPREYQRFAADMLLRTRNLLLADDVGVGKQHAVDTMVSTPTGFRRIGDLVIGDLVTGSDGKPTEVVGVFPQGVKPSYRVTFSDGASVEAGPEHLWALEYYIGGRKLHRIVVTTDQIRTNAKISTAWKGRAATTLDLAKTSMFLPMLRSPIEYAPSHQLEIPSYLMGQLIANGTLGGSQVVLTTHTADWPHIKSRIPARWIGSVRTRGNVTVVGILGAIAIARRLGIDVRSRSKFIPLEYMRAHVDDRVSLLQGLMDGDGSISKTGNRAHYHTTSSRLAGDVRALVEELGGTGATSTYDRSHESKPTEYCVRVRLPGSLRPCSTPRKASRYIPAKRTTSPTRSVSGVEFVRDVESVCIAVAADDHLYVTEHAIVTHNTCSAIAAMTAPGVLPAVIVTPTHLPPQWEAEIRRFAPNLSIHRIRSGQPYELGKKRFVEIDEDGKRKLVVTPKNPDVIIVNYHKLVGWVEMLSKRSRMVVFDEIQELRHAGTNKYNASKAFAATCDVRLGMSATPVYNYGGEIFAVTNVIAPGALGAWDEFSREWCGSVDPEVAKGGSIDTSKVCVSDPAALGTYMRESGLMLRRTRKQVGRELPDMTVVRYVVDADTDRIREATADVVELAQRMLDRIGTGIERMQWASEIDYRMRLATGMAKAPAVADLVRMLVDSGEQVLLGGWHHLVYDIWRAAFDRTNYEIPYAMYTGEENEKQKAESVRRFVAGEAKVMMMSVRSGIGVDGLQKVCAVVVNGELDWSPQVHHQFGGRLHRDGQTRKVVNYFPVATSGSDPVIEDVLGLKAAQAHGILNPDDAGDPLKVGSSADHIHKLAADILARHRRDGAAPPKKSEEEREDAA